MGAGGGGTGGKSIAKAGLKLITMGDVITVYVTLMPMPLVLINAWQHSFHNACNCYQYATLNYQCNIISIVSRNR